MVPFWVLPMAVRNLVGVAFSPSRKIMEGGRTALPEFLSVWHMLKGRARRLCLSRMATFMPTWS